MSWLFDGLPLHPLFVHASVVAVPLVAILAIAAAWAPRVRRWLGIVLPILASVTFLAALFTKLSGEALETQLDSTAAITAHTGIADIAVAAAFLLLIGTWVQWGWRRVALRRRASGSAADATAPRSRLASVLGSSVLTALGVFAIVAVVIVGDSGARAVWG